MKFDNAWVNEPMLWIYFVRDIEEHFTNYKMHSLIWNSIIFNTHSYAT